jgi:formamidopyrimidine-DNA glycosylase
LPELPEVETVCRMLVTKITGKQIQRVIVRQPQLRWPVAQQIFTLAGETILQVRRRAKYILLQFTHGCAILHLGMSGTISIVPDKILATKHDHIDLYLPDSYVLRFRDPRRFGCVLWSNDPAEHPLLKRLGMEPLAGNFDGLYLYQSIRASKKTLKSWLMDNRVVVGVGNIYASEVLYRAQLDPMRIVNTLSVQDSERLALAIVDILQAAITHGGSSLRDFKDPDGQQGDFVKHLQVYGRVGEPCNICGAVINKYMLGNRATYSCALCQL